jgi:hypothetical protein
LEDSSRHCPHRQTPLYIYNSRFSSSIQEEIEENDANVIINVLTEDPKTSSKIIVNVHIVVKEQISNKYYNKILKILTLGNPKYHLQLVQEIYLHCENNERPTMTWSHSSNLQGPNLNPNLMF